MSDEHPSEGLVPPAGEAMDGTLEAERLGAETPDAFGEPMTEDELGNALPEEGVTPEEVAFEADLEEDLTGLSDPVAEDLAIDEPGVPDPEDDFLEPEDTEYTNPDEQ